MYSGSLFKALAFLWDKDESSPSLGCSCCLFHAFYSLARSPLSLRRLSRCQMSYFTFIAYFYMQVSLLYCLPWQSNDPPLSWSQAWCMAGYHHMHSQAHCFCNAVERLITVTSSEDVNFQGYKRQKRQELICWYFRCSFRARNIHSSACKLERTLEVSLHCKKCCS